MDGVAILLTYAPSLIGGALSRKALWAAGVGAALMSGVILSILSFMDRRIEGTDLAVFVLTFGAIAGAIAFALKKLVVGVWQNPSQTLGLFAYFVFAVLSWVLYVGGSASWVYALWTDAREGRSGMFMLDLLIPPFGAGRGALKFFGFL